MTTIFITYTLLVIFTVAILYMAYKYTFENKMLKWKEWGLIACGAVALAVFSASINVGINVNNKLSANINLPKEVISTNEIESDSTITKSILYNFLLDMRAPFPEIMLCQALLESQNFTSPLYIRQSNMFGMKSSYSRPSAGDNNRIYQDYNGDWRLSVLDYTMWILKNRVDQLSKNDYIEYLGRRYAEDPKYKDKIRKMLKDINFEKLKI